jgi:hypothetical protein
MKKLGLFFMLFLPFFCFSQVNESFTDGNFTLNPTWTGTTSNFMINSSSQLQSQAVATSVSYLFTPSEAIEAASWECWVKITYSTSSSNYASIYLISDKNDLTSGCNGYYVQIGGTNDEVSLFVQEGAKKTKIIDGVDKRTDGNTVELRIKVTRDKDGNFSLYSKLATETEYFLEGTVQNKTIKTSSYFGVLFSNTSTTGSDYYFDEILVTGDKAVDTEAPVWNSLNLILPDKMLLKFSESMDFSSGVFEADNGLGTPESKTISVDKTSLELTFANAFERGLLYNLQVSGLKDLAGNPLPDGSKNIGIIEPAESDDVVFNEVMFENPLNSLEYIEFTNTSEKVIDLSGKVFTTRKTDGTLNTGNKIPIGTVLLPHDYLAVCEDADSVRNYHHCPPESNIISTSWSSLNNESATLVLCNAAKDTIFDEFTYNTKWHHVLVKNPKGVALEKINPLLPANDSESWHSASSETNYGTPGYANSQFRDIATEGIPAKTVWVEPEAFSPDNDGVDDVCFIRYKTETNGYVANVLILNPIGVKVAEIAKNNLLSSEGFYTWDGKTDAGKNANVGIYVLYFEIFNPQNGKRKQFKLPVVVSAR